MLLELHNPENAAPDSDVKVAIDKGIVLAKTPKSRVYMIMSKYDGYIYTLINRSSSSSRGNLIRLQSSNQHCSISSIEVFTTISNIAIR